VTRMMASRQRPAATVEDAQRVLEDEEALSGPGEGDEIMEEAEEQEDGYSEPFVFFLS
jgi:casein kinase II subunit beta